MKLMFRSVMLAMVLVVAAGAARAQVFYSYPGAKPVTDASPSLGLVAGFGDNVVRLGGFGRFNLTQKSDLGLEAMYNNVKGEDSTDDTGFYGAGIDAKWQFFESRQDMQIDIAANVGGGFLARSGYTNIHVPIGAIASHDFTMNDGRLIVPYAGVYFLFDYVKFDVPGGGDDSNTDGDAELRIGASAEIVKKGSLFAALHAGNGTMFFIGFNAGL
ncbi:MAG TPA: hypothetical protein VFH33_07485 [Candidatus Krumholzibacteria bacterium]|nr:hypothetical protein [Candidatus Krumholzibacteria bacterium]